MQNLGKKTIIYPKNNVLFEAKIIKIKIFVYYRHFGKRPEIQ
jgi:hypothetical protein